MPHTVDPKVYLKLSPEERVRLMDEIYQSLVDEGAEGAVPGPDADELRRRIFEHSKDPTRAVPWDEARKRLGWK